MMMGAVTSGLDRLRAAGEALYGPRWITPLADRLDIGVRLMQRYAAGDRAFPPRRWLEVRQLLTERRIVIDDLCRDLADEYGADEPDMSGQIDDPLTPAA